MGMAALWGERVVLGLQKHLETWNSSLCGSSGGLGRDACPFLKGRGFFRVGWVGFAAEQGLCGRWRCASGWVY